MRILSVANRLPVTIGKTIRKSSGGLVAALDGVKNRFEMKWIGWPGANIKDSTRRAETEKILREEHDCNPIFLTTDTIKKYYHGFCNSGLWPLLHYMSNYVRHDSSWWRAYRRVNERFADAVLEEAKKDDLVWVHDYHLMLLPQILRERKPDLRVGFFLHTPFPSYEVFRCHPHRQEILEGVLGSDLIGFHTFGYMRHFRSSVMRILGYESEVNAVHHGDRTSLLNVFPIGINAPAFQRELATKRFEKRKEQFRITYHDKKIILGVERLDYTKGIPRRLDAVDRFLKTYPEWRKKAVFLFIAIPSRGEVVEYQDLRQTIESQVGRINGRHATIENIPIHFIHKSIGFTELCALYSLADVAMVTPIIDGMNLVAKEYIACKQSSHGVLILSEFAGAANELFDARIVNPFDHDDMAESIQEALTMPEPEKRRRMASMYGRVTHYDARKWAAAFIKTLEEFEVGTGGMTQTLLPGPDLEKQFSSAKKIALFLDYDGSLREFEDDPDAAGPTPAIHKLLDLAAARDDMDVHLISGRNRKDLEKWFGEKDHTLIAEHGLVYNGPTRDGWHFLVEGVDLSWKEQVAHVFQQYVGTTPGSFMEEKACALVWHYRRADPEFGSWKAHQLVSSLSEILSNLPVEVNHGQKIVEVSSYEVSKRAAVQRFTQESEYDLIFCAGDDLTDETMFRLNDPRLVSLKIGSGATDAQLRIETPSKYRKLLTRLIENRD